jgi:hypothetical protein
VGLCYVHLDESKSEWELGGIIIGDSVRKLGLGSVLARLALCHVIATQRPWKYGQKIIAHVHEANPKPRNMLAAVGFKPDGQEVYEDSEAPPSLARNSDGKVVGDKFHFPPESLIGLVEWLRMGPQYLLRDKASNAILHTEPFSVNDLLASLQEATDEQT